MRPSFSRRQFLYASAFATTMPLIAPRPVAAAATTRGGSAWPGYAKAVVIDGLGGPGRINGKSQSTLDAQDLADVRACGLSAVNVTVGGVGSYQVDFAETVASIAAWDAEVAAHPDLLMKFARVGDIAHAKSTRRLALIYGLQDTTALGEDPDRLETFRALGVRIVQLTYNRRNLVGDGCLEPGNAGLSLFGRDLIERMNTHGMLVDLSHCGERTTDEAIALSTKAVAITHAGCRSISDLPRNKSDATLRLLADRGGVFGIYLAPYLRSSGQPMAVDVIAHIEHALRVCGEDHVGIGTDNFIGALEVDDQFRKDFAEQVEMRRKRGISAPGENPDAYLYVPDLNTPRRLDTLAALMAARGHPDRVIAKVIGGNFQRLFAQTWPATS